AEAAEQQHKSHETALGEGLDENVMWICGDVAEPRDHRPPAHAMTHKGSPGDDSSRLLVRLQTTSRRFTTTFGVEKDGQALNRRALRASPNCHNATGKKQGEKRHHHPNPNSRFQASELDTER